MLSPSEFKAYLCECDRTWGLSKPEEMWPLVNGHGIIGQRFQGGRALGTPLKGQTGMSWSFSTLEPLALKCGGK